MAGRLAATLVVALALSACGGGSGTEAVTNPAGAACASSDPAAGADQPPDEITYLTAFGNVLGREGYVYVADAIGAFAEQNLQVTIEPGVPRTNTAAVLSGQAQFAAVDSNGVLIRHGIGTETDTVIVSAVQQLPTISLITLDIASPYELEGKVVGAVEGPAITETLFPTYAELVGIDADTVRWEHMGQPDLIPALVSGRVDAIALFLMSQPTVTAVAGREAHVLPYSDYLTDLFGTVHITAGRLAETNPELVRRFNAAIMKGLECAVEQPEQAGQIVAAAVPEATPEAVQAELEVMAPYVRGQLRPDQPTGAMDQPKVVRAIAVLEALGDIPAGLVPTDVVAFDVVPGGGEWR